MNVWIIVAIVVAIILIWGVTAYNNLVRFKTWMEESWSEIDVQLKRRNDLIPNLVETVKGYAKHEKETLAQVIAMRNQLTQATQSGSREDMMQASDALSGTLKTIFALSESYPDLKANHNFMQLQEELVNTENKISYARKLYNATVAKYNIKVQVFPSNIIASLFGFTKAQMLETPEAEKQVPTVKF